MKRTLALLAALAPLPAAAHPHVFIDTGLTLILDAENRLVAVRVTWAYDELYSLLVLDHYGADPDFDGVLTDDGLARIQGFDMAWAPGFEGDTYASLGETPLALGPPQDPATWVEEGRVVTAHTREVLAPSAGPVSVKAYDPTFYNAYEVTREVIVEGGTGCAHALVAADLDAAYTMLEELLYGPRSAEFDEDNFPEVGEKFATEVRLTCASGS